MPEFEEEEELLEEEEEGQASEMYEHHRIEADNGQNLLRVDKFLMSRLPNASRTKIQEAADAGNILVNGKAVKSSYKVKPKDIVSVVMAYPRREIEIIPENIPLNIVYEDDDLIIVNKPAGMVVHEDEHEKRYTLIDYIKAYLYQSGSYRPEEENSFAPALCNRIDRNTGGIVIAAKNAEALRVMNQKIKDREIDKRYLCIVHGTPRPASGRLEGQLFKDAKENRVYITKTPQKGSKTCVTLYKTLQSRNGLSLVECELVTGRTHQIRAQMAAAGWPLLGDGKYGKLDKRYDRKFQALYSYKLTFQFTTDAGCLSYLNGRTFQVESVDFVQEYFT